MIAFTVRGLPVAQGTARAFVAGGSARIATDSNRLNSPIGAWRAAIASACAEAMGSAPALEGPVRVRVSFVFPRPGSHYLPVNGSRSTPELKLTAPRWVSRKPDVDKLTRALLDGITNIAIRDDGQVARLVAQKFYEDGDLRPGCEVTVERLEETR